MSGVCRFSDCIVYVHITMTSSIIIDASLDTLVAITLAAPFLSKSDADIDLLTSKEQLAYQIPDSLLDSQNAKNGQPVDGNCNSTNAPHSSSSVPKIQLDGTQPSRFPHSHLLARHHLN